MSRQRDRKRGLLLANFDKEFGYRIILKQMDWEPDVNFLTAASTPPTPTPISSSRSSMPDRIISMW